LQHPKFNEEVHHRKEVILGGYGKSKTGLAPEQIAGRLKLKGKTSKQTRMALNRRLCRNHKGARLSITCDNGTENVEFVSNFLYTSIPSQQKSLSYINNDFGAGVYGGEQRPYLWNTASGAVVAHF